MGDVDIHVPTSGLAAAAQLLTREGWLPKYGMTLDLLVKRTVHRRDSWNFTKGTGDIDLHWRVTSGTSEKWLTQRMWESAEQHDCYGRKVLLQSPEFAAATNIAHGFKYGTHGDALQTVIDAAALLPICKAELLLPLVQRFGLLPCLQQLLTIMDDVGRSQPVSHLATPVAEVAEAPAGRADRESRDPARHASWRPKRHCFPIRLHVQAVGVTGQKAEARASASAHAWAVLKAARPIAILHGRL